MASVKIECTILAFAANSCSTHILLSCNSSSVKGSGKQTPAFVFRCTRDFIAEFFVNFQVMLLSMSSIEELYRQSCSLAEDPPEVRESFQHPTRLIQFLVGLRGKSEPMAIGGPWSPSLDGPNPEADRRVLVNTAIRTTRALTGIDLSCCTQWLVVFIHNDH